MISQSFKMDMTEMVIEVKGIPENYHEKTMIDKLTIHFLRRSNSGGDVSIVIYPTSNKGQAYVIFETAEVPGLLQHTHVLEVDSEFYPLSVKKVHQPQMDMPAEAVLNITKFSSQSQIYQLLHDHGFKVSKIGSEKLLLQGSFLKLNLIYPKVMQLLAQETQSQMLNSTSPYMNGYSSASRAVSSNYESSSNVTTRRKHKNVNSVYAESRSPSSEMNSKYPESPNRLAFLQAASLQNANSSTESFFSSPSRSYEDSRTSDQQWRPSSSRQNEDSFHVEKDALEYILNFKDDFLDKIKSDYHTHITYNPGVDSELTKITVSGGGWEEATTELRELIQQSSSSLCTQIIDLNKLDNSHKKYISKEANSFQKIYKVLIRQEDNVIKVVGSSKDSYEAKQELLRQKVEMAPPKPMERGFLRRSSSLPRQNTKSRMDNPDFGQSHVHATTLSSVSASHSQMDSQVQRDVQQERGRKTSRSTEQRGRAQSASRLQHKNLNRADREQSNNEMQDLALSNEVQKSKQKPTFKNALFSNFSDNIMHFKKKKK